MNLEFAKQGKRTDKKVMRYIEWFMGMYAGDVPTVREIMNGADLKDTHKVFLSLRRLERDGYIRLNPTRGRHGSLGIKLTAKRYDFDS